MRPEVCVVDVSMPRMDGTEAATRLRERAPEVRVVFLSVHEDRDFVRAVLATEALGYVVKSRMASDLRATISEALEGRLFVSPSSCCYAPQDEPRRDAL